MSIPGFDKLTVDSVASHTKTEETARLEKQVDVNLQRKQIKEKKEGKSHATTNASLQGAVKQIEAMAKIMDKTGADKLEMQRKKLTRKVKKYKNNRFFVDVLKDVPMPKAGAPIEEWSECLDEIRSVLGSANALEQLWNHLQRAVEMVVALNIARPAWFGGKNLHSPQNFALVMRQPETRMKLAKEIEELAVVLFGAGLPQLRGRMGRAKSYAERLFEFPEIGALPPTAAAQAITKPALAQGVKYEAAAIVHIVKETQGYPYFLQEWGKHAWDTAAGSPIRLDDVRTASASALAAMDENFFRVRFDRLTPSEKRYLRAMAELGPGPHRSGDIADQLA